VRGHSRAHALAEDTVLVGDDPGPSMAEGTMLAGVRQPVFYGAAAIKRRRDMEKKKGIRRISVVGMIQLEQKKGAVKISKANRALEERAVKRRITGDEPVLERTPIEPPGVPERITSGEGPTRGTAFHNFLVSQLEWLTSPAQDVTQAKEDVSAWPREANYPEPGEKQLDVKMAAVLEILERVNFGLGLNLSPGEVPQSKPLVELGYSVRLCVHHHRDARTNSGRAARLRQRFFLQVVDWRVIAETDERFVVLPNEYLGQWAGKRLRVKEPAFSGGPNARGSDAVSGMVRDGKAIVYDHDFTNVITMPQGVRCHLIHREVRLEKVGQTHHADHPWSDGVHLWRALKAKADKDGNYSVGKIPNCKIFDKSLSGMVINPDKNRTIYSAGMLLDDLRRLAQDMSLDGNLSDDGVGSGPLLKQMYKDLLETCTDSL